jgi:molecular chaperone GrpE
MQEHETQTPQTPPLEEQTPLAETASPPAEAVSAPVEQQEAAPVEQQEAAPVEQQEAAPAVDPVAQLEAERTELQREVKELQDKLLRHAAEFDNARKRLRKEVEEAGHMGREGVLRELLPALDNLERALKHAAADDPLTAGVKMVEKQLLTTLEKFGVARFSAMGQPFQPALHEAVQEQESAETAPNTVVQEFASGYRLGDRLLRPAMVAVAKLPATSS